MISVSTSSCEEILCELSLISRGFWRVDCCSDNTLVGKVETYIYRKICDIYLEEVYDFDDNS